MRSFGICLGMLLAGPAVASEASPLVIGAVPPATAIVFELGFTGRLCGPARFVAENGDTVFHLDDGACVDGGRKPARTRRNRE